MSKLSKSTDEHEHWVLHGRDESLGSTPETNTTNLNLNLRNKQPMGEQTPDHRLDFKPQDSLLFHSPGRPLALGILPTSCSSAEKEGTAHRWTQKGGKLLHQQRLREDKRQSQPERGRDQDTWPAAPAGAFSTPFASTGSSYSDDLRFGERAEIHTINVDFSST